MCVFQDLQNFRVEKWTRLVSHLVALVAALTILVIVGGNTNRSLSIENRFHIFIVLLVGALELCGTSDRGHNRDVALIL